MPAWSTLIRMAPRRYKNSGGVEGCGSTGLPGSSAGDGSAYGVGWPGGSSAGSSNGISSGRLSWRAVMRFTPSNLPVSRHANGDPMRSWKPKGQSIKLRYSREIFELIQRVAIGSSLAPDISRQFRGPNNKFLDLKPQFYSFVLPATVHHRRSALQNEVRAERSRDCGSAGTRSRDLRGSVRSRSFRAERHRTTKGEKRRSL
jgi:hypothetical protein